MIELVLHINVPMVNSKFRFKENNNFCIANPIALYPTRKYNFGLWFYSRGLKIEKKIVSPENCQAKMVLTSRGQRIQGDVEPSHATDLCQSTGNCLLT